MLPEGKALEGDRPVYRAWRADNPPWLIRSGVLISGWLFIRLRLDLFPVDWKIEGYADCDSKEIRFLLSFYYDVNLYDTPFSG